MHGTGKLKVERGLNTSQRRWKFSC